MWQYAQIPKARVRHDGGGKLSGEIKTLLVRDITRRSRTPSRLPRSVEEWLISQNIHFTGTGLGGVFGKGLVIETRLIKIKQIPKIKHSKTKENFRF